MAYKDKSSAIKYNNEYNSKAYDRINFTLPKGEKEKVPGDALSVQNALDLRPDRLHAV